MARPRKYNTHLEVKAAHNESLKRQYAKRKALADPKPEPRQKIKKIRNTKPLPVHVTTGRIIADKDLPNLKTREIDLSLLKPVKISDKLTVWVKPDKDINEVLEKYKNYAYKY